ncbi:MAG: DUF5683 domain-containing protein [Sphingobacteriales bacterium]|jgi:hypothetical protein
MAFVAMGSVAQQKKDSSKIRSILKDSAVLSKQDTAQKKPKSFAAKAASRAAMLPGWGQIYNKKYWKLPIVYGALAIPVVTFNYNLTWYKKTREAYRIRFYNDTSTVMDLPTDKIDQRLLPPVSTASLRNYRNTFRQDMDYSVLAFLVIWGLQIVDATVDAHLKSFNVNDDLSLRIKPVINPGYTTGLSFIFTPRTDKPVKQFTGF